MSRALYLVARHMNLVRSRVWQSHAIKRLSLVNLTEIAVKLTETPVKLTDIPIKLTETPIKLTDIPINLTDKPMNLAGVIYRFHRLSAQKKVHGMFIVTGF